MEYVYRWQNHTINWDRIRKDYLNKKEEKLNNVTYLITIKKKKSGGGGKWERWGGAWARPKEIGYGIILDWTH